MTIGQALAKTHKEKRKSDTESSKMSPLMYYLEFNYNERYVTLCERVGITPVSFPKWLLRDINTI